MSIEEVIEVLRPPILGFKAEKRAIDPVKAFAVLDCSPLKTPYFRKTPEIHVMIPKNYKECRGIETILNDLKKGKMTGKYPRSRYKPFREVYDLVLDIKEPEEYVDESEVYRKIDEISRLPDKETHVIVIVSLKRSPLGGFYYNIKIPSIQKGVQTQFVLRRTIGNYVNVMNEEDRGDFLWNLSLSIFSKLGGIPWKLQKILSGVAAFISLNTVTSYREGIITREGVAALEIANRWGDPVGRFFAPGIRIEREKAEIVIDPSSIQILMKNALDKIEEELVDPKKSRREDYIIIHVNDRYADSVYDAIKRTIISKGFSKFKIIHIQEEGGLRLYDPTRNLFRAWPEEGSYWFLEKGKIAFLYTLGKWKYTRSEPYIIGARDVSPLQVNFVKGNEGSKLTIDDLRHIYHLTRLHYYSADIPRIKMPCTIRLGTRAARLAACGLIRSDFDISFLY